MSISTSALFSIASTVFCIPFRAINHVYIYLLSRRLANHCTPVSRLNLDQRVTQPKGRRDPTPLLATGQLGAISRTWRHLHSGLLGLIPPPLGKNLKNLYILFKNPTKLPHYDISGIKKNLCGQMSSKTPIRNFFHPSIHESLDKLNTLWIMLEGWIFAHKYKNHISWWSMMARITPSSNTPVRNYQCPPSMTSIMGVLDTLLIMLESQNLAQKSRITNYDDPWCQGWPHPPRI